jgi:hypothetical protein
MRCSIAFHIASCMPRPIPPVHHFGQPRPDSEELEKQPYAIGLFMTVPGVKGVAEPAFAG